MNQNRILSCLIAAILIGGVGTASGATKTFVGLGSPNTSWEIAGNWSPSGAPTASDTAIIPDMATTPVSFVALDQDGVARKVVIQNGGNLRFTASRTLDVGGDFIIQPGGQCSWPANNTTILSIGGNFVNDGSFMAPTTAPVGGAGFIVNFNGSRAHTISGSSPTQFYRLTIGSGSSLAIDGSNVGVQSTLSPSGYSPTILNGGSFNGAGAPLPISLVSFGASVSTNGSDVKVVWRTLSETDNYGFTVERKPESGSVYQAVGFVATQGNGIVPHDYAYADMNVSPGRWHYRLTQTDLSGAGTSYEPLLVEISGLTSADGAAGVPAEFGLKQNYPNPFNPSTAIAYQLPAAGHVQLIVYDALGREVTTLVNEQQNGGSHIVTWNAAGMASGVYFCRLVSGEKTELRRMVLLK